MRYSECDQEKEIFKEGNSTILESPDKVILQLDLSSGADCYTYQVTASDGTNTVVIQGKDDQRGKGQDSIHSKIRSGDFLYDDRQDQLLYRLR